MSAARIEWALLQQLGGHAVSLAMFLILAALLRPEDFGVVGMASVWVGLLTAFAEGGLGAALVQRETVRPEHVSTTFAINLAIGGLLSLVAIGLAYPAAWFYRTPAVAPVMAVLAAGFVLRGFGLTQAALAQRELNFRALAVRDLLANALGGGVGIALAVSGYGVWSLVAATLISAAASTVLLWRMVPWRPRWREVSRAAAAELWPYGSRILGFNLFKTFAQNTDRLVIGVLLGAHAVGLYTFAARLVIVPASVLAGAFGVYVFPRVARLQADAAAVRELYRRVTAVLAMMLIPTLVAAALLAPVLVPLLGPEWRDAVPLVQVLTVAGLMQAIFPVAGQLMKGLARPGWLLVWSVGFAALTLLALVIGALWGVGGMAAAFSLAHLLGLPIIIHLTNRLVRVGVWDTLRPLLLPLLASLPLAAAILLVRQVATPAGTLVLGLAVIAGGLMYLATLERLSPGAIAMVRDRWRPRPAAGGASGVASGGEAR